MKWIDYGVEQNWGSHHTSNANLSVKRFDAGMGWRGNKNAERGEGLDKPSIFQERSSTKE